MAVLEQLNDPAGAFFVGFIEESYGFRRFVGGGKYPHADGEWVVDAKVSGMIGGFYPAFGRDPACIL